ncbi:hypothetical protein X798_00413 [Onchocerca flexuosa]|uniref:Uncharacterized protein n=1 Tax=Onchocerca flexuosa TaxID=387005 RepID=A0A238C5N7_9BILA|nr:hypothetical protein X798_00413 [Onchocerca flexuosa]
MIAQKLAQLNESTNRWRYQRSHEVSVPETRGILSERKSALLEKQDKEKSENIFLNLMFELHASTPNDNNNDIFRLIKNEGLFLQRQLLFHYYMLLFFAKSL